MITIKSFWKKKTPGPNSSRLFYPCNFSFPPWWLILKNIYVRMILLWRFFCASLSWWMIYVRMYAASIKVYYLVGTFFFLLERLHNNSDMKIRKKSLATMQTRKWKPRRAHSIFPINCLMKVYRQDLIESICHLWIFIQKWQDLHRTKQ